MTELDDSRNLFDLFVPGTHNSVARGYSGGGISEQCQSSHNSRIPEQVVTPSDSMSFSDFDLSSIKVSEPLTFASSTEVAIELCLYICSTNTTMHGSEYTAST